MIRRLKCLANKMKVRLLERKKILAKRSRWNSNSWSLKSAWLLKERKPFDSMAREVDRAAEEVKAWEEASSLVTFDQLFEDDAPTDESQAGVLPRYQPREQRSETRSEVNRRIVDQVTTWRKKIISIVTKVYEQGTLRSAPMSNHFVVDYPPPRPVIPQFEDHSTEYLTFAKAFKTYIGDRGLSGEACLTYLYCSTIPPKLEDWNIFKVSQMVLVKHGMLFT